MPNNKNNTWITKQEDNFAQWYTDVCYHSELFDYGFVKGSIIFKPYGLAIWENIHLYLDKKFKKLGVQNVYFPMLIPKSLFAKETKHIKGFNPELATVTKIGDKPLAEELYIRPTSEVVVASQFAKQIKSHRDLPIMYNQWCNVVRWEKNTRPFLRTNEFLWQEGHTLHADAHEAQQFSQTILSVYAELFTDVLDMTIITGEKTAKERFAGAIKSYTIESLMHDGVALQCGTSHYFGDEFAKLFNISFENSNQKRQHPFGTSWGVSTRVIGAIIMAHGDNNGLVLPFDIAPIQIQVILLQGKNDSLREYGNQIVKLLEPNYRVQIKQSNKSFGFQIKEAETKGIPLRIELGFKNVASNTITLARRDLDNKLEVPLRDLLTIIRKSIREHKQALKNRTSVTLQTKTIQISNFSEYKQAISKNNVIALAPFCGTEECEDRIKEITHSNSRCIPFIQPEISKGLKCFKCDTPCDSYAYFAKAY